ncbi:MAG: diguanylate cyclase, partial [Nitriliruptorales bacterium]|nr:diguanylate cyclase [Nitriliruptorales bacterium]
MLHDRTFGLAVVAMVAAVIASLFQLDAGSAAAGAGTTAAAAALLMVRRRGSRHDAAWRRAWTSLALAAGVNGGAGYAYVHAGTGSWVTLVAAAAGAAAVATAGFSFLQHRLSRGRAVDVLFEGILAGLAIALSLSASTNALQDYPPVVLAWLAVPLVYLAGVWVLVRAFGLSRHVPLAPRMSIFSVAGYFGVFGLQGVAPLLDLQVVPEAMAIVVALSSLALVGAVSHPSVDEPFAPVPAAAAGLTRGHVILLMVAIVTAPLVSVVRHGVVSGDFGLQFAMMILFPLLVVAHLIRQVQERATGEYRAQHDDLTGLPNRVLFHDRLEVALAQGRRQQERIGVMFVDLDRFKRINDSLGHDVGDEVLRQVAYRLRMALREEDTVARLGGDEFAVLLHDADPSNIQVVGDKLLGAFEAPLEVDGRQLPIGTSIGVAVYPDDGDQPEALLKYADIAMYRAKSQSRSNLQFYTEEMSAKAQLRLALESALRTAVKEGELAVHYQPRVSASSGKIIGFEALVRWS